jgi:competence protein ComEC
MSFPALFFCINPPQTNKKTYLCIEMTFTDYLQTQPLLRVAIALMLGIVAGDGIMGWFPTLPQWSVWVGLALTLCFLLLVLFLKRKPYTQSVLLFAAVFFTGVTMVTRAEENTRFPFSSINNNISENRRAKGDSAVGGRYKTGHCTGTTCYEAVVISEPQVRGKTLRCDLALTDINGKPLKDAINVKAAILRDTVTNDWKTIGLGTGLVAQSVMQPLRNYRSGNFDYVRWLHIHGFRAQTFIYYSDWQPARVSLKPMSTFARMRLYTMMQRQKLVSRLMLSQSEDQQSAIIAAMVLGDKHAISQETKDAYAVSGASHILALSGLHLSIIYAVLLLLFGRGFKRRWLSQAVILLTIWGYVFLVGMGSSVVRSAVMLSIYSLCIVSGRDKASINALSLAAVCLLVANPLCLWDIGFEMSFMAVLGILVFYKHLYRLVVHKSKEEQRKSLEGSRTNITNQATELPRWKSRLHHYVVGVIKTVWGMISVSVSAQITTAPLVAYYFGRFSCYFLLTNFIVIPCATLIIYLALTIFITTAIHPVNILLLSCIGYVSTWMNNAVKFIASLPGASIENIHTNGIEILCVYVLITISCIIYSYVRKLKGLIDKGE